MGAWLLHGSPDFRSKKLQKNVDFIQRTYPQYAKFAAARSFVYRTIKRHKLGLAAGEALQLDPMRDRRGENRPAPKRKNVTIVAMCERLLNDDDKTTCPKIHRVLADEGHHISTKTIQRIAQDLDFVWTKPWHTDVLTSAQMKKREIFCRNLLTLTEEDLLQRISE